MGASLPPFLSRFEARFLGLCVFLTAELGFVFFGKMDPGPAAWIAPLAFGGFALGAAGCLGRTAVFFYALFAGLIIVPLAWQDAFSAAYLLYALGLSLVAVFMARRFAGWGAVAAGALCAFLIGCSVALGGYESRAGALFGAAQIVALIETNALEAFGYAKSHPFFFYPAALVPISFGLFCVAARRLRHAAVSPDIAFLGAVLVALGLLATPMAARLYGAGFMIRNYDSRAFAYRAALPDRLARLGQIGARRALGAPKGPFVIVVGESANRNHMHLYGYGRPTTPVLDGLDILAFDNVVSSYNSTTPSLSRALTTASLERGKKYDDPGVSSLVEICRAAGFRTLWLSNQARHGLWNQSVTDIASAADALHFSLDDRRDEWGDALSDVMASLTRPHDEILLPSLAAALEKRDPRPLVLFVHLMGAHTPYPDRYPARFAAFKTAGAPPLKGEGTWDEVDAYDNAILYTDWVLGQIITLLRKAPGEPALLYFSDHGESPFLRTTHDPAEVTIGDLEIPFVLWLSDAYRARHKAFVQMAQKNLHKPFMLDHLAQAVFDLTGVTGPFVQPARSLFSPDFIPTPRLSMDGALDVDSLPETYCALTRRRTGALPAGCP